MRTRMNKPALLLSLLALAALGLVACGGDDEGSDASAETDTTTATARPDTTADNKSCGRFGRYRFAVAEGDVSCRVARRVMRANACPHSGIPGCHSSPKMPGSWSCGGSDAKWVCVNEAGEMIKAYVTCNANRLAHGDRNRSRCPGWIKRSEVQRRHGRESDASAATTTAPAAGTDGDNRVIASDGQVIRNPDGDNRVKLYTPLAESVFVPATVTAEAGDLTIVWENGGGDAGLHNICMADEQGKPVFNQVVFNGGRERTAARGSAPGGLESTPRCSQTTKGRTIRARAKVKPGEYTYYCSVGRQREAGMEGTLTVK
jgi:plastocyanin